MRTLIWFRRDLRVLDNTALFQASQLSDEGVVGLFIITPQQWKQHDEAACKVKFWLENLKVLSANLRQLGIPLLVQTCDGFEEVPARITDVARTHGCSSVFFNREYEVNELERDRSVMAACEQQAIRVQQFHDRVIVPPREIRTGQGKFYSVFTPYRKAWNKVAFQFLDSVDPPRAQSGLDVESSQVPDLINGFATTSYRDDLWPAGEEAAHQRLADFVQKLEHYSSARDIPSVNGTSLLSPYLAAGVISPRQCLAAAIARNGGTLEGDEGTTTWISELTWRDFYTHVLEACPRVSRHQPFKLKTNQLNWRESREEFERWASGQTGYPIVDAGMRQLNRTGWMHNRLRMVTAMFLTKNLLIDWRWGERYFMQNLIDGDLAANNGGWQWSASTGTDAVPYFRIFNPFSQSKRFDPQGEFIKRMCPELSELPAGALHDPGKLAAEIQKRGIDYPGFVVDYKQGRERALRAFKALG